LAADTGGFVSASSIHSGPYLPEYAVDGNAKTRWASVVFSDKPQWLQIDFGKTVPVEKLVIRWETAHAVAYQLQLSDDGRNWQTLHESQDCKGGREVITGLSGKGRYFRVLCLKPASWGLASIWEIEFPDGQVAAMIAEAKRQAEEVRRKAEAEARQRLSHILAEYGVEEVIFAMRQPGKDGHWYANFSYYADDENRLTYGMRRRELSDRTCTCLDVW